MKLLIMGPGMLSRVKLVLEGLDASQPWPDYVISTEQKELSVRTP